MQNDNYLIQIITEKSHYTSGEQVNGLALVEIKTQTNNIELTLNCAGVEKISQTSTEVTKEEVFHYSEFITLYKGSLSPSKYKFPFTYALPLNLPPSCTYERRGMTISVDYQHKAIIKIPSRQDPYLDIFELKICQPEPKVTALQCNKEYLKKNTCCGVELVKVYSSIGTNMFLSGTQMPVYINIDKTAARYSEYEIELRATEFCEIRGDKINRSFEEVKSSNKFPLVFESSELTKSVVLDIPLNFSPDFLSYQGKLSTLYFNADVIIRIKKAPPQKSIDYHMRLIYPVMKTPEIPQLITKNFSEFGDWRCPQELGAQISVFQIEQRIQPYQVSQSRIGVQNNNIQLEEGNSFWNPFSETRSRGGTGLNSAAGSGFGIAVPIKKNIHRSNLTRNPDETMRSSFISREDEKKRKLLDSEENSYEQKYCDDGWVQGVT